MRKRVIGRAELLSDSAVYRRTSRGQRALSGSADEAGSAPMRVLARVNGFTDLRRLVDLTAEEGAGLGPAVEYLVAQGWIELVESPGIAA